ncbi:hypothetical protein N7448_003547 [Penicillium atrosanguineum]|uniref:Uncharacterized protein n=1 Tax=Penicillium atrosanguineum TaxID=1132637 RepID=A0A9W9PW52_9EURO|nr:hypothetical protein N7448_003547 [Penicillium atrosanguineum]KAJ5315571.1 hypothetical protein N7476_005878 [Penicillium atrosanguineum]
MSFKPPSSNVSITIDGLGKFDSFHYANGVEQLCGTPYATPAKQWGPTSRERVEKERGDETIQHYSRFKLLLALGTIDHLWDKYLKVMDFLLMKRDYIGKGERWKMNRADGVSAISWLLFSKDCFYIIAAQSNNKHLYDYS